VRQRSKQRNTLKSCEIQLTQVREGGDQGGDVRIPAADFKECHTGGRVLERLFENLDFIVLVDVQIG